MSARAIPAHLETEVLAKHREGLSLRAISSWLLDAMGISASRESVSGVLHHNVSPSALADSELASALSTRAEELVEQLFECMNALRELRDEPYTPESKPRINSHIRILKEWSRIALSLLRGQRRTPRETAPAPSAKPVDRVEETAPQPSPVATLSPCPAAKSGLSLRLRSEVEEVLRLAGEGSGAGRVRVSVKVLSSG